MCHVLYYWSGLSPPPLQCLVSSPSECGRKEWIVWNVKAGICSSEDLGYVRRRFEGRRYLTWRARRERIRRISIPANVSMLTCQGEGKRFYWIQRSDNWFCELSWLQHWKLSSDWSNKFKNDMAIRAAGRVRSCSYRRGVFSFSSHFLLLMIMIMLATGISRQNATLCVDIILQIITLV